MPQDELVYTDSLNPMNQWKILKNVIIISFAFMIHFIAFSGASNLQSSINAENGLGTASLAAMHVGVIFSNTFLLVTLINWLGTKWTMSVTFVSYMPYIAAQLYPTFYTLIPAGVIMGIGGGPLWCAKCTYISLCAEAHHKISKESVEALLTRFLGLFYMIYQINQVLGNLISSLLLNASDNPAAATSLNETMIPLLCGADFLPSAYADKALLPQPPKKIQLLSGIYLACMAAAALIVTIGVDSMKRYEYERQESGSRLSGKALLVVTLKLMVEPTQLLLVTINIFIGLQQAFIGADFAAAFVSCAVGTGSVGFVMMTYGVADAIACIVSAHLAKVIGRLPIICTASIIHASLFCTILMWQPHAGEAYIMYIMSGLWGICDAVWQVQINSYYGILFPGREEAAFSNNQLWQSVGYIIAYTISAYLRTSYKTYLLFTSMLIGVVCYFIVEYQQYMIKKKKNTNKTISNVQTCDNFAFQNDHS